MKKSKNEIVITLTIVVIALTFLYLLTMEHYNCEMKKGTMVKTMGLYRCVKLVEE